MISITAWLKNPDYKTGVELYLLHGKSETLKGLFQSGATPFTRKKLAEELGKLAQVPAESMPKEVPARKEDQNFTPIPDWVMESRSKQIELLKERDSLRGQLFSAKTDSERLELALRILDLGDEIHAIGVDQKQFKDTGKVPTKQVLKEKTSYHWKTMDDISLMEYLYNSLNVRVSRARRKKDETLIADLHAEQVAIKAEIETRRRK